MNQDKDYVEHKLDEVDSTLDRINVLLSCPAVSFQKSLHLKLQKRIKTLEILIFVLFLLVFSLGTSLFIFADEELSRLETVLCGLPIVEKYAHQCHNTIHDEKGVSK